MGKRKVQETPPQWLCPIPPKTKSKGFGRVYIDLLESKNFINLSDGAKAVYMTMSAISRGKKEFYMTASEAENLGYNVRTFRRRIDELIKAGFIRIKESGKNTRTPNIYEFTLNYTMIK